MVEVAVDQLGPRRPGTCDNQSTLPEPAAALARVRPSPRLNELFGLEAYAETFDIDPSAACANARPKNRLLSSLPRADFARLRPHLRTVPIAVRQILHPRNEPIREIYFPNGGVASVTAVMRNGAMVEIATIGDEGLVGMNAFFGSALMSGESMMQVPDTNAEVMSVQAFHERARSPRRVLRRGPGVFASARDPDDAVNGVHGASLGAGALLPMAADDARPRPPGRLSAQS